MASHDPGRDVDGAADGPKDGPANGPADGPANDDTKIDLAPLREEGQGVPPSPQTERTKASAGGPIDDVAMYDVIEPEAPAVNATRPQDVRGGDGKARIEAPGLIEDFDEDADFSEETVLNDARRRNAAAAAAMDDTVADDAREEGWDVFRPGKDAPQFVKAKGRVTLPGVKVPAIVGGVLILIAMGLAFARVQDRGVYASLGVLYLGLMHSITGVGAVAIGALDAKARFGSFPMAWARMLVAVALLLVVIGLPIQGSGRLVLAPIAALVYGVTLYLLFRWKWRSVGIVAAAHFGLWLLLYVGQWLHAAVMNAGRTG